MLHIFLKLKKSKSFIKFTKTESQDSDRRNTDQIHHQKKQKSHYHQNQHQNQHQHQHQALEPEQSTEINLFLEKDTYKKRYNPSHGEEQAMEFINLVGGYRKMKTTEDEINAQKEIKKDRKEKLESKLKEIMKKACPEKFDEDLYTGDFNEFIIYFLKTDAMKDPPKENMDDNKIIDNIDCIKAQIILLVIGRTLFLKKYNNTNNLSKRGKMQHCEQPRREKRRRRKKKKKKRM